MAFKYSNVSKALWKMFFRWKKLAFNLIRQHNGAHVYTFCTKQTSACLFNYNNRHIVTMTTEGPTSIRLTVPPSDGERVRPKEVHFASPVAGVSVWVISVLCVCVCICEGVCVWGGGEGGRGVSIVRLLCCGYHGPVNLITIEDLSANPYLQRSLQMACLSLI